MSATWGGTFTREGVIPHLKVKTEYGTILAPVKVMTRPDRNGHPRVDIDYSGPDDYRQPMPLRRNGRLVFALPGGGEVEG
jgi:hypothetical protein